MNASTSDRAMPVTIHILDKEYRIACSAQEQHGLLECARLLDERMRDVRQNGRVVGTDRIAVMASLNLIYDLMNERDAVAKEHKRLKAIQKRLSQAIETGPTSQPPSAEVDAANEKV